MDVPSRAETCPHRAASLFMVLALAVLWDPAKPMYSAEATDYYHLASTALSIRPPALYPTVSAVQAIVSDILYIYDATELTQNVSQGEMVRFLFYSDMPQSSIQAWVISGIAVKLALSVSIFANSDGAMISY